LLLLALASAGGAGSASAATPGKITVISDSVMTAILWNAQPLAALEQGFPNVDMEVGICRVIVGESCDFMGGHVPSMVDEIQMLGNDIGQTVVVEVGYNDPLSTFASEFQQAVQDLLDAGVTHIFWLNYHVWLPEYATMNQILATAAKQYPQVTIVDWASDSYLQYNWFQGDGIHLIGGGAMAMATLVNHVVTETLTPLEPPTEPVEHVTVGKRFSLPLKPNGGVGPYAWQVELHALPRGLHLLADGVLEGALKSAGSSTLRLKVTDAAGWSAQVSLRLVSRT
jgi:hypothetical protein